MSNTPLQRAPAIARDGVVGFLETAFPAALAAYRADYAIDLADMPNPQRYSRYELQALDLLPAIAMNIGRTSRFTRMDIHTGANCYELRSQCRVYCWVKRVDEEPTQELRDDYVTVLASVLLDTPGLGDPQHRFRVEEDTMEVTYSDVTKVKGDRWISGAAVAFDLTHSWNLRRVPLGSAESVTVSTTVLPRHPALD